MSIGQIQFGKYKSENTNRHNTNLKKQLAKYTLETTNRKRRFKTIGKYNRGNANIKILNGKKQIDKYKSKKQVGEIQVGEYKLKTVIIPIGKHKSENNISAHTNRKNKNREILIVENICQTNTHRKMHIGKI